MISQSHHQQEAPVTITCIADLHIWFPSGMVSASSHAGYAGRTPRMGLAGTPRCPALSCGACNGTACVVRFCSPVFCADLCLPIVKGCCIALGVLAPCAPCAGVRCGVMAMARPAGLLCGLVAGVGCWKLSFTRCLLSLPGDLEGVLPAGHGRHKTVMMGACKWNLCCTGVADTLQLCVLCLQSSSSMSQHASHHPEGTVTMSRSGGLVDLGLSDG